MTPEFIDRRRLKAEMRETVRTAQVSPRAMTALYLGICLVLNMIDVLSGGEGILSLFASVLVTLVSVVLGAGFVMYVMAIVHGERAEFLSLFDGFSMAGKLILLYIIKTAYITLWSMLFVIPGIIAIYRYRFAELNLYENPELSVFEAIQLSKRQTMGYKRQLFFLDLSFFGWSLLATVPLLAENAVYYAAMTTAQLGMNLQLFDFASLPGGYAMWVLFSSLWQLVISVFYLAYYHGCIIGYYETAKASSRLDPCRPQTPQTPDGL